MRLIVDSSLHCVLFSFRRQAYLCVLAMNCSEAAYVRLVEALCNEHQIKILKVNIFFFLVYTCFPITFRGRLMMNYELPLLNLCEE